MKIQSYLKSLVFIALLGAISFWNTSCRSYDKKIDLKQVDSLNAMIKQASDVMVFDDEMIEKRADSINMKLSFIRHNFKAQLPLEVLSDCNILEGIKSNYRQFLKDYPVEEYDNKEHTKRISNLKADLVAGRLSITDFDKIYKKERPIISKHLEEVINTSKSIRLIENQYHRSSISINKFYEGLQQKLGAKADKTIDKDEEERD